MRLEPFASFKAWAAGVGLQSRRSRGELVLRFSGPGAADRYWLTPHETKDLLVFVSTLLDAGGPWECCWVLKRGGVWDDMGEAGGLDVVLKSLAIPVGFDGAIQFGHAERPALALLMTAQIAFGWCGYYDLWVAPDHARMVISTDDDGITPALFADETACSEAIDRMRSAGFELPDMPPEEGFYWQDWMGPKPRDWPS